MPPVKLVQDGAIVSAVITASEGEHGHVRPWTGWDPGRNGVAPRVPSTWTELGDGVPPSERPTMPAGRSSNWHL